MAEEKEKAVKCLRELRSLLMDDEKLKSPIHDEKFLIRFVRAKKYNSELAYKAICKYYTMRKKNRTIAKCLYPSYDPVKYIFENNILGKLKHNDPNGCTVVVYRNGLWDMTKLNMDDLISSTMIFYDEILMFSLEAQLNGIVVLFDMENFNMSQVKEYTLARIVAIVNIFQGSYPLRLKGAYLVNQPSIIDYVLVPMRPFLNEKTKQRLLLIGEDMDRLHGKLPKEILPPQYGGTLAEEDAFDSDVVNNMFQRDNYYKELMEYGYGEAKSDVEDTYM